MRAHYFLLIASLGFTNAFAEECADPAARAGLAKEACEMFGVSPPLAEDKTARKARAQCEEFYAEAYAVRATVCNYKKEAEELAAEAGTALGRAGAGESGESQRVTAAMHERAAAVHKKVLVDLQAHHTKINREWREYSAALAKLAHLAHATAQFEIFCESTRAAMTPSNAPAFLLRGIQDSAHGAGHTTFSNTTSLIRVTGTDASRARAASSSIGTTAAGRGKNAGTLSGAEPEPHAQGRPGPSAALPAAPRRADYPVVGISDVTVNNPGNHRKITQREANIQAAVNVLATGGAALLVTALTLNPFVGLAAGLATHQAGKTNLEAAVLRTNYVTSAKSHLLRNPRASSRDIARAFAETNGNKSCR